MREISLTRGYVARVDDEDFADLSQYKWHALVIPQVHCTKVYAARAVGQDKVYMHRQVTGAADYSVVDHADGDGLNNQRQNLRVVTHTENQRNHNGKQRPGATSKYIGVFYLDPSKPSYARYRMRPYKASIQVQDRTIHVGYFATEDEAARARDVKAIELHGEFAVLNFPR